jgi:hypothetical protein
VTAPVDNGALPFSVGVIRRRFDDPGSMSGSPPMDSVDVATGTITECPAGWSDDPATTTIEPWPTTSCDLWSPMRSRSLKPRAASSQATASATSG